MNKLKFSSALVFASIFSLNACSSIVQGRSDKVNVSTPGAQSASCQVKNSLGEWNTNASQDVEVKRSKTNLEINCTDTVTGATGNKTIESSLDDWTFGNILIGGIIGLGVDLGTGAAWQYPKDISVDLQQKKLAPTVVQENITPPMNGAAPANSPFVTPPFVTPTTAQ